MKEVLRDVVGKIAWSHPALMHVVLALSCAHQRRIYSTLQLPVCNSLRFAEATHWGKGLRLHRQHLSGLRPGLSTQVGMR
ncbi:unnamed protein product [Zymoseptoria tritici ST99CH_3D7]|uniref:Uncharacterized protein n=1 Tax=Zymoseptoria tritici (strain ST99CH_3D7) TaxID=1276538 RepID=A0A1X7RUH4_ZYMT9|nr:unnamed protein product [Zymoseptoria tritici ST99CH_3D7]